MQSIIVKIKLLLWDCGVITVSSVVTVDSRSINMAAVTAMLPIY